MVLSVTSDPIFDYFFSIFYYFTIILVPVLAGIVLLTRKIMS